MTTERPIHTKVTRQDWIDAALASLEHEAIDQLRVLTLARTLDVSRSSFYWYFESPAELQAELMNIWERNTTSIVERTERDTADITAACLGVFECWADATLYSPAVELSVRDWARRDASVAGSVAQADLDRLAALTAMFEAHQFEPADATVRARLLYHSQIGYYALGTDEPMATRLEYLPYYLEAMTGQRPSASALSAFAQLVTSL